MPVRVIAALIRAMTLALVLAAVLSLTAAGIGWLAHTIAVQATP